MLSKRLALAIRTLRDGGWQTTDNIIIESWSWHGTIEVITRDRRGRFTSRRVFSNLIVDSGRNLMRDAIGGAVTDAQIHYVALGNSNTAAASGQTQLVSEQFRKAVTTSVATSTGARVTTVYIAPGEALSTSFTINEIGWFAGATATATANSGVMVARVLYNRAKAATESIQINRTDQF